MFTLPLDSVMWCCEVQIFSNLFVTLEGARLSMKPAQKNPNQVLEEKLSYNDIIWLLIPVLSEAGSTLGHFQTYTFLHRLSQFKWIFLSLAKQKKSNWFDLPLTCSFMELGCREHIHVSSGKWFFEKVIDPNSIHLRHLDNSEVWSWLKPVAITTELLSNEKIQSSVLILNCFIFSSKEF